MKFLFLPILFFQFACSDVVKNYPDVSQTKQDIVVVQSVVVSAVNPCIFILHDKKTGQEYIVVRGNGMAITPRLK